MHRGERLVERGIQAVLLARELQLRAEQRERRAQLVRGISDKTPLCGHLHAEPRDALIDRFDRSAALRMQALDANRLEFIGSRSATSSFTFISGRNSKVRPMQASATASQRDHFDLPHELGAAMPWAIARASAPSCRPSPVQDASRRCRTFGRTRPTARTGWPWIQCVVSAVRATRASTGCRQSGVPASSRRLSGTTP